MRLLSIIGTTILSLAIAVPLYAQQEQHDQKEEEKAKPEEKKAQPEKPARQAEKQQPQKDAKPEEKSAQQQDKNHNQPEQNNARQENQNNQQENRNAQQHSQQSEPAKQAQHGNANRIPDDRYRANFGREHSFRVSEGDYRNHRFQYGGYWFGFAGEWPSNWLYTQDVFVIEIDGAYYLCNPMYPGVNIAIDVTM
jgi:hypothetical protein